MAEEKKYVDLKCPRCKKVTHFERDADEHVCECGCDLGRAYEVADLLDDADVIRQERAAARRPARKKGIFG